MQRWVGVKAFFATPVGRIVLLLAGIFTLVGSFLYLGLLIAIPTLLLFGLVLPILLGQRRMRDLAIGGLVILLVAAPVASIFYANMIRMPGSPVNSPPILPVGNGGSVLQNAQVNPFTGPSDTPFTFTASLYPQYVPKSLGPPLWVNLYVSTCPGATANTSFSCGSSYPFYHANQTLPANVTAVQAISMTLSLPGNNLWWWQMAAVERNLTAPHNLTYIFLDAGNGYGTVQGPVSGDYLGTVSSVLPAIYLSMFTYVGLVFYIALLVYYFFKSREQRRKQLELSMKDQVSGASLTTTPAAPGAAAEAAIPATPRRTERSCPNCNAVVYEGEANCWKCGSALTDAATPSLPPEPDSPN